MNIKDMLNLYKIEKVGLYNETKRMCCCETELSEDDKKCPNCGATISKGKLLNISKNGALGKRYETVIVGNTYSFKYNQLLSNGFELYEVEVLDFSIDKETADVKISNSKVFKSIEKMSAFDTFMKVNFDGLLKFVYDCLNEFQYSYAKANFSSLSENEISNFVHVFYKYNALIPFLRGYKVFYYGKKINLQKYYPTTNFNNFEEVKSTGLNLNLLISWDIKNEKYIESIIDISKESKDINVKLVDILCNMLNDNRSNETYNNTIDSFGLLYNKEISLQDFIRIYNNSRDNWFNQIFQYRKLHKKIISKTIDWSTVEKIDKKTIGTLSTKEVLKNNFKMNKAQIDESFKILETDPLKALKYLAENNSNKYN